MAGVLSSTHLASSRKMLYDTYLLPNAMSANLLQELAPQGAVLPNHSQGPSSRGRTRRKVIPQLQLSSPEPLQHR
eukprot:2093196-Amphidinium_carterae.1